MWMHTTCIIWIHLVFLHRSYGFTATAPSLLTQPTWIRQKTRPNMIRNVVPTDVSTSTRNPHKEAYDAFTESLDQVMSYDDEEDDETTWQANLEMFLNPTTSTSKRQILFNDLLSANEEIRESVFEALRERKIDPILTPTGKKLQEGTKAVARQIAMDILPSFAESILGNREQPPALVQELPNILPKVGERMMDAIATQAKIQMELLQGDIVNPSRIPQRMTQQTVDVWTEAKNIFLETPIGLSEPKYKVLQKGVGYEIREYEAYTAAATSMAKMGEVFSMEYIASGSTAFHAIASYLFGANREQRSMSMTTPVITTSAGEMRFYLSNGDDDDSSSAAAFFPEPLAQEKHVNEKGAVRLVQVAPARLAVARFSGFVTDGEVMRQRDILLNALDFDHVEIDVPHGSMVPYFIFQYNPPYTLPIVRRNEIAIPVRDPRKVKEIWTDDEEEEDYDDQGLTPSDVNSN